MKILGYVVVAIVGIGIGWFICHEKCEHKVDGLILSAGPMYIESKIPGPDKKVIAYDGGNFVLLPKIVPPVPPTGNPNEGWLIQTETVNSMTQTVIVLASNTSVYLGRDLDDKTLLQCDNTNEHRGWQLQKSNVLGAPTILFVSPGSNVGDFRALCVINGKLNLSNGPMPPNAPNDPSYNWTTTIYP